MPRDPKKINSLVFFDWETGGLLVDKNPVCSFAGVAVNGTTFEEIVRYDNIIKPYDASLVYEAKAMQVNGLTVDQLKRDGINLSKLVEDICALFTEANVYKTKTAMPILVAHNAGFDIPFLIDVFARCKTDLSKFVQGFTVNGTFVPMAFDTIQLNKMMRAPITDNDTKFGLGPCCTAAGIETSNTHSALEDSMACGDLFKYMINRMRSGSGDVVINGAQTSHRRTFEWA